MSSSPTKLASSFPVPRPDRVVYRWCMSRTNIDIDDELIAAAMRRYGLRTKREAVDLALRRLVGPRLSPEFLESLEGLGWQGDLEEMRRSKVDDVGCS